MYHPRGGGGEDSFFGGLMRGKVKFDPEFEGLYRALLQKRRPPPITQLAYEARRKYYKEAHLKLTLDGQNTLATRQAKELRQ